MGELYTSTRNYEGCACEAPVKEPGVCTLTQQLTDDLIEIRNMCGRVDAIINGPKLEESGKRDGPSGLKEHLTLNLEYTVEIRQMLYRILEALDG